MLIKDGSATIEERLEDRLHIVIRCYCTIHLT